MPKVYFGHPVNVYNTDLEISLLKRISSMFPSLEIENPNQEIHEKGYQEYKRKTGEGMKYFMLEVLPSCRMGIFLPFRDGKWGAGVFKEAQRLEEMGMSVFEISAEGDFKVMNMGEINRVLSVEETRARIRDKDGNFLSY